MILLFYNNIVTDVIKVRISCRDFDESVSRKGEKTQKNGF
jgi:hypothetical protein